MTTLFGDIIDEKKLPKKNKTKWSYSKREIMNQCLRKYYYTYYDKSDTVSFYNKFANKHLIVGDIIHSTIEKAFKDLKYSQNEWDIDNCLDYGTGLLKSTILYTSEFLKNNKIFIPDTIKIFKEIALDNNNVRDLKNECENRIFTSLNNLYQSGEFEDLIDGARSTQSEFEKNISLQLTDTITVYGKIDIVYSTEDGITIADWKTGKNIVEDSSLQLSVYGLWASMMKFERPDKIFIQKAYLFSDECVELQFDSIQLERAKVRIIQDSEIIDDLNDYGKRNIIDAFDKCDNISVCNQCQFKNLCY